MNKYFKIMLLVSVAKILSGCGGDSATTSGDVVNDPSGDLITYTPRYNISNNSTYSRSETFTISSDGKIHAFWMDGSYMYYSSSADNGNNFQPPKLILSAPSYYSFDNLKTSYTENAIHLTWTVYDTINLGAEIFYFRSMNGGDSFSVPLLISNDDGLNSYGSSISTDGEGGVSIAWSNEDVGSNRTRFVVSMDDGGAFTAPSTLPAVNGLSPSILMTPSVLFASWTEGPEFTQELYFAGSADGGSSFTTPMNISQYPQKSWPGKIAHDDAGTIYVVWAEGAAGEEKILLTISVDGGQSFSAPKILSNPAENSYCPSIAAKDTGSFYVTWSSRDIANLTYKSYIVSSTNGGLTYSPIIQLPMLTADSNCPKILTNGSDQIGILWHDTGVGESQFPDIFFSNLSITVP